MSGLEVLGRSVNQFMSSDAPEAAARNPALIGQSLDMAPFASGASDQAGDNALVKHGDNPGIFSRLLIQGLRTDVDPHIPLARKHGAVHPAFIAIDVPDLAPVVEFVDDLNGSTFFQQDPFNRVA